MLHFPSYNKALDSPESHRVSFWRSSFLRRLPHVRVERLVSVLLPESQAAALPCGSVSSHQGATVHSCGGSEQDVHAQPLPWWVAHRWEIICMWMNLMTRSFISAFLYLTPEAQLNVVFKTLELKWPKLAESHTPYLDRYYCYTL